MISINKLISGNKYDIYAVAKNQECLVQEFIDELQEADRKKIVALLKGCNPPPAPEKLLFTK